MESTVPTNQYEVLENQSPSQPCGGEGNPFNRSPHSTKAKALRVLWQIVWALLFVPSPRSCHGWRQFLLRLFGAKTGKGNHFYPTCRISEPWRIVVGDYSCVGPGALLYASGGITIGSYVTISQYAHICTSSHDYNDPAMRQTFTPVSIADRVWVCADAFIGPGVTVHNGAVVGARAVVTKDIEPWAVVAGNPARQIGRRRPIDDRGGSEAKHIECEAPMMGTGSPCR